MGFHVHVYQVASMGEVNLPYIDDPIEAREIAMQMARESKVSLRFPDCGTLAIAFPDEFGHGVIDEDPEKIREAEEKEKEE